VLRFWNHEVLNNLEAVLEQIHAVLANSPHPNPPPEGEGVKAQSRAVFPLPPGEG
jgi:hypothetical protein